MKNTAWIFIAALSLACASRRPPSGDNDGGGTADTGGGGAGDGGGTDGSAGDDGGGDAQADGGGEEVAPSADVTTPTGGSGDIVLNYVLRDANADPVSIGVEWSADASEWQTASPAAGTVTTGLGADAGGVAHSFRWASAEDLDGVFSTTVRLRLTPHDGIMGGAPATTGAFTLDNRAPNTAPDAAWGTIASPVRGDATFAYFALDAESDTLSATAEYRIGAGGWSSATLASTSNELYDLPSSPGGAENDFTWASAADIPGDADAVQLRITLDDGRDASQPVESATFSVRNAPQPGGVRFTEVSASTADGAWFELTNTGTAGTNVDGWTFEWTAGDASGEAKLPNRYLDPGARLLVREIDGSGTATIVYLNSAVGWAPASRGAAALRDAAGAGIDFLRWGGSDATPPAGATWTEPRALHLAHDLASLVRVGGADTDSSSDFCAARGTMGTANAACYTAAPAGTTVRLVELFAGTTASGSATDNFVEIRNDGSAQVSVEGWTVVSDNGAGVRKATVLGSATLSAAGRLTIRNGAGAGNGTTLFGAQLAWSPYAAGAGWLTDRTGEPMDFARWGGFAGVSPPPVNWTETGALPAPGRSTSIIRATETSTTTAAADWCVANASPGAAGTCLPPVASSLKLNEIGMGELFFRQGAIEVLNPGSTAVDMTDWGLAWNGGAVVFGAFSLEGGGRFDLGECPGGFNVSEVCLPSGTTYPWGFYGGPGPGFVELLDPAGRSVDFVRWGGNAEAPASGGGWADTPAALATPAAGKSLGRYVSNDTNAAADWCQQSRSMNAANNACLGP